MSFLHSDNPTYDDMAMDADDAEHPELWPSFAWSPGFGQPYTSVLQELIVGKNPGALTSMDQATAWVLSEGRWALESAGTDDVVVFSETNLGQQWTVAFWCKKPSIDTIFIGGRTVNMQIRIQFAEGVNDKLTAYNGLSAASATLTTTTGNWLHAAFSVNGTAISFYETGASRGTGTLSAVDMILGDLFRLLGANYYAGTIDDVLFYRRPLSANEVSDLSSLGRGGWATKKRPRWVGISAVNDISQGLHTIEQGAIGILQGLHTIESGIAA